MESVSWWMGYYFEQDPWCWTPVISSHWSLFLSTHSSSNVHLFLGCNLSSNWVSADEDSPQQYASRNQQNGHQQVESIFSAACFCFPLLLTTCSNRILLKLSFYFPFSRLLILDTPRIRTVSTLLLQMETLVLTGAVMSQNPSSKQLLLEENLHLSLGPTRLVLFRLLRKMYIPFNTLTWFLLVNCWRIELQVWHWLVSVKWKQNYFPTVFMCLQNSLGYFFC